MERSTVRGDTARSDFSDSEKRTEGKDCAGGAEIQGGKETEECMDLKGMVAAGDAIQDESMHVPSEGIDAHKRGVKRRASGDAHYQTKKRRRVTFVDDLNTSHTILKAEDARKEL